MFHLWLVITVRVNHKGKDKENGCLWLLITHDCNYLCQESINDVTNTLYNIYEDLKTKVFCQASLLY